MNKIKSEILLFSTLLRPHQYIKNLVIFFPPFFGAVLADAAVLINAFVAFASFSFTASAVYILNDWKDADTDRLHPEKCRRPLAAGLIPISHAFIVALILCLFGLTFMFLLDIMAFWLLLFYLVMNVAYSLKLKQIAIVDITVISLGFVVRLLIGAAVTGVFLSHWIITITFLLALFLALAKRRDDVLHLHKTGNTMRESIHGYSLQFVDSAMMICASITLVSYIMWSISPEVMQRLNSENLYQTSVFVILGILRYMQITIVIEDSGSPTRIVLKDRFIQLVLLGWLLSFIWIFYLQ